jgi:hypothetical protein
LDRLRMVINALRVLLLRLLVRMRLLLHVLHVLLMRRRQVGVERKARAGRRWTRSRLLRSRARSRLSRSGCFALAFRVEG